MKVELLSVDDKFVYVVPSDGSVAYHDLVVTAGGLVGVASKAGSEGDSIVCEAKGVFTMPKDTGITFNQGAKVYMDGDGDLTPNATRTVSEQTVNNTYIGIAWKAGASADTTLDVRIN